MIFIKKTYKIRRIRLTESQLNRVILNTAKRLIREARVKESPIYNEDGEIIDMGGYYDTEDYDDYDSYDDGGYDGAKLKTIQLVQDIESGKWDDHLEDYDYIERMTEKCIGEYFDGSDYIGRAINDRQCALDRRYAMRHGRDESIVSPSDGIYDLNCQYNERNSNLHSDDSGSKAMNDNIAWARHASDEFMNRNPHFRDALLKKNGETRKPSAITRNMKKYYTYETEADERPLHRKGSLNRADW